MSEIITVQRLDRPMEILEPYIAEIHNTDQFKAPFITPEERRTIAEINSLLDQNNCIGSRYYIGANRGIYMPVGKLLGLWEIDSNIFTAEMSRATYMKLDRKTHDFSFKGLCLEFVKADKLSGDDYEDLPDVIDSDAKLVFSALSLRHTIDC